MTDDADEGTAPAADRAPDPPPTRRDGVTETRHGVEVADPYRWLEGESDSGAAGSDAAVREWTASQTDYADAHLDTPARERLRERLDALADVGAFGPVEPAGGRAFRTVRDPGASHERVVVREADGSPWSTLADPAGSDRDGSDPDRERSLAWALPAPDGESLACGVVDGAERVDIRVVGVPDGETVAVLPDRGRVFRGFVGFDALSPGMVAWEADGRGLVYVATGDPEAGGGTDAELRRWRRDGGDERLLALDGADGWPLVRVDRHTGTAFVARHDATGTAWHVLEDGTLRPVLCDGEAETFLAFHRGRAFVRTDRAAPRKRLLACSTARLAAGEATLADCETVLPEREAVLGPVVLTSEHLVAQYLDDAAARLAVFDHAGEHVRDLPVPDHASVSGLRAGRGGAGVAGDAIFYRTESFDGSPALVRADPATGECRELDRVEAPTDAADLGLAVPGDLVVRRTLVDSTDGAAVPLFVCHRADLDRDGDNPAVLSVYGGFGRAHTPAFDRFRLPFLADGGVYAQVCARGGGEYGEAWHAAATGVDKPRTFDDVVAAGEHLCDAGYTAPDRLGLVGRSNGGLSAAAALVRRPGLWGAVHAAVPLADMLRYHELGMGAAWTGEYGDPGDPEAFDALHGYSPYHAVDPDVDYPPVLVTTGADDTRVHPAHARKLVARLQDAGGGPALLRTWTDAGHGAGESTATTVEKRADAWAFLSEHLVDGA